LIASNRVAILITVCEIFSSIEVESTQINAKNTMLKSTLMCYNSVADNYNTDLFSFI